MLLLLPICACADGGADLTPSSLPDSPTPPVSQEPSPTQSTDTPTPTENTEPTVQEPDDDTESETPMSLSGEVTISFDFVRQFGSASNQHAVWIEDSDGNVVRSLFASRWTANGGYNI